MPSPRGLSPRGMAARSSLSISETGQELPEVGYKSRTFVEVSKNETSTHARYTKSPLETNFALLHLRFVDEKHTPPTRPTRAPTEQES